MAYQSEIDELKRKKESAERQVILLALFLMLLFFPAMLGVVIISKLLVGFMLKM